MDDQTNQCEQDCEAEVERLATEAEEEAARLAGGVALSLVPQAHPDSRRHPRPQGGDNGLRDHGGWIPHYRRNGLGPAAKFFRPKVTGFPDFSALKLRVGLSYSASPANPTLP